jgi:hypothetical protein
MKKKLRMEDLGSFEIQELDDGQLDGVLGASTNWIGCNNPNDCRDSDNWLGCTNQRLCPVEVRQV